jgi:hypothetical protein
MLRNRRQSSNREAAMKARLRVHSLIGSKDYQDEKKKEKDGDEEEEQDGRDINVHIQETLKRVREHRKQRYQHLSTTVISASLTQAKRSKMSSSNLSECPTCFICGNVLVGNSEDINRHIDDCLATIHRGHATTNGSSPSNDPFETYTWAGQTRIRATSLLEGGLTASGFQTHKGKDQDVDFDLDVEKDHTAIYGPSQFTERDLIKEDSKSAMAIINQEELPLMSSNPEESWFLNIDTELASSPQLSSSQQQQTASTSTLSSNHTLLLESLKTKIGQQERLLKNTPKCMICLESYTSPLTSILCWHVYCEACWLKTLGTKKVCPQCIIITAPSDLRRIYL